MTRGKTTTTIDDNDQNDNHTYLRGGYVPGEAINIWATIDNQVFYPSLQCLGIFNCEQIDDILVSELCFCDE